MSQMQINQVLAQIRSLSSHGLQPTRPGSPGVEGAGTRTGRRPGSVVHRHRLEIDRNASSTA